MTLFWCSFPAPKAGDRKSIQVHTEKHGFPELEKVQLAIIGVQESRNSYYPVLDYDMDAFEGSSINSIQEIGRLLLPI